MAEEEISPPGGFYVGYSRTGGLDFIRRTHLPADGLYDEALSSLGMVDVVD
jgi:hypothetical protein